MKEFFRSVNFSAGSRDVITQANNILSRYAAQGYDLSLRQLYYQFVSANLLANTEQNYKRLGSIISDARDAGLVDWDMIHDRGREVMRVSTWGSPADVIDSALSAYKRNLWEDQPAWIMCMVEKQALEGVLEPVCRRMRIPFSANKGYASSSHLYEIGKTIANEADDGKDIHVIYLGDHDPSGIDMTRDVEDRLKMYSEVDDIEVHRVALNMPQVRQYAPPPNPAKLTDSRASGYVERFGSQSWELDALNPSLLASLVEQQVLAVRDADLWAQGEAREQAEKDRLSDLAAEYRDKEADL